MTKPFVGLPASPGRGCAYADDITSFGCTDPATVHIASQSPAWGLVALAACDRHAPIARAAGETLAEHRYRAECDTTDCWAGVV